MTDNKLFDPRGFAARLRGLIHPEKHAAFCERAGISLSVLNKYLAAPDGLSPSAEMLARICRATRASLDWLIMGEGDSGRTSDTIVNIPACDDPDDGMPFTRAFLARLGYAAPESLCVLHAEGDSMEPLITDGAPVLIDRSDARLREGVFAFRIGEHVHVKRLRPAGSGGVEILPANPAYPPETLPDGRFVLLGRAIWTGNDI
ncbi:MAG TPA: LexA family transcriptional regulator [Asticcacaulis sp.]